MRGNPWGVPRALPGSHDLGLLQECLKTWRQGEPVLMPCFDKAQRQGRGDRSGWRSCDVDLLIFEGWFVGCRSDADPTADEPHLEIPLRPEELMWRQKLQAGAWSLRSHLELFRPTLAVAGDRPQRALAMEASTGRHPSSRTGSIALEFRAGTVHPHDSLLAAVEQFSLHASGCCCGGGSRSKPSANPPPGARFRIRRPQTHSPGRQNPGRGHLALIYQWTWRAGRQRLPWPSRWRCAGCAWPWMFSSSGRPLRLVNFQTEIVSFGTPLRQIARLRAAQR